MTNTRHKFTEALLSAVLTAAVALAAPLTLLRASAAELNSSSTAQDAEKAYYSADYEYLNGNEAPVFESITLEEAIYLFQQEGNYLVLLGGSWCGNTRAVIDIINDYAVANKFHGIQLRHKA